ncbi:RNA polymerase II transcription factor B 52 kDa subunit [Balamuthia mandrillaris]
MNVFDYVSKLPQETLDKLYTDPWTCQAIFRSVPPLGKQFVLRLLFLDAPVVLATIQSWVKPQYKPQHDASVNRLLTLKVLREADSSRATSSQQQPPPHSKRSSAAEQQRWFELNPVFKSALRVALYTSDEPPWATAMSFDKRAPSVELLARYTKACWESLLHFMVGTSAEKKPSSKLVSLLVSMQLMQIEGEDVLRITEKGFQFLLKDVYTQVWTLLLAYIDSVQQQGMDLKDVLSFLFQLSFCTLGKDYPVKTLTEVQLTLLKDLKEFGLIYQRKKSSHRYYPTQLAINLSSGKTADSLLSTSDTAAPGGDGGGEGWIILSTNYHLYAHTSSPLHILLLSLFVKLQYQLPNLVVGVITRESVRAALMNGITAQNILDFLEQNAHPEMRRQLPVIPETIADEIRLWESERNRVTFSKGVLYDHFPSAEAFAKVEQYAKDMGVCLWSSPERYMLIVSTAGHELVRPFIQKYRM